MHKLLTLLLSLAALPASALAQPVTILDPAKTVIVAVDVTADGQPLATLPDGAQLTYSASTSSQLAMRWCSPGLPGPAACALPNAGTAFLVAPETQAYGRVLPNLNLPDGNIFVNLRMGGANVASAQARFVLASAAPTPTPTTPPETPTHAATPIATPTPVYGLSIRISQ